MLVVLKSAAQDLDDEDFSLSQLTKQTTLLLRLMILKKRTSHVNFMDIATNRAAYRLADNHDQEVLGYLSGYKQGTVHANADTVNDTVNGTVAVATAGTDELLTSMKLRKDSLW